MSGDVAEMTAQIVLGLLFGPRQAFLDQRCTPAAQATAAAADNLTVRFSK